MKEEIMLRTFHPSDREALETIVRETWQYDRLCSPRTAKKLARVYVSSCLANQTFTQVALVHGHPVGVIMGKDIRQHHCPLSLRLHWVLSIMSLYLSSEGRRVSKIFAGVQNIDQELLARSGKSYSGELAFFAISQAYRGRGLGKRMFYMAVEYLRSKNIREFYLFTDTSCHYPFYEHLGMTRRCELQHTMQVAGESEAMTFFLYDCFC